MRSDMEKMSCTYMCHAEVCGEYLVMFIQTHDIIDGHREVHTDSQGRVMRGPDNGGSIVPQQILHQTPLSRQLTATVEGKLLQWMVNCYSGG